MTTVTAVASDELYAVTSRQSRRPPTQESDVSWAHADAERIRRWEGTLLDRCDTLQRRMGQAASRTTRLSMPFTVARIRSILPRAQPSVMRRRLEIGASRGGLSKEGVVVVSHIVGHFTPTLRIEAPEDRDLSEPSRG